MDNWTGGVATKLEIREKSGKSEMVRKIREKSGNFTKFSGKFLALKKFNMRTSYAVLEYYQLNN